MFLEYLALPGSERQVTLETPPSPVQKLTDQIFSWH